MKAGDEIENELRDGGVLTDDNKAWGNLDAPIIPEFKGLLIVAVEGFKRRLQSGGEFEWIELFAFTAPLLRHVLAYILPEVSVHWHFVAGYVFGNRDARQLDDSAFNGVHEGEIAHRPRKHCAFCVAGAT